MEYIVKCRLTLGLIVYSAFSVVYLYMIINLIDLYQNLKPSNENTLLVKNYQTYYYTGWNLVVQMVFLALAFVDELIFALSSQPNRILRKFRSYVFTTLVFPNSVMLVLGFWLFFFYDRELIYPKNADDDVPPLVCIFLHLFVIFPVFAEIFVARKYGFKPFRSSWRTLLTFLVIYNVRLILLYFLHGVWLYPFYKIMSKAIMLSWTALAIISCLMAQKFGEALQLYVWKIYLSEDENNYSVRGIEKTKAG